MIVPGGGLYTDGPEWIARRKNFFLSVRVMSRLYRRLILEGLIRLHDVGKLQFFGDLADLADRDVFNAILKPLRKIDWVVYAKEPFAGPKAVLAFLSRYTHRIAISNSRLIRIDQRGVTFRVKNYRVDGLDRHTTMTLKTEEFIRRFLIHALPKGQHRIRHYGFFGNGKRVANIAQIRRLLRDKTPARKHANNDSINDTDQPPRVLALPCPYCGVQLLIVACYHTGFAIWLLHRAFLCNKAMLRLLSEIELKLAAGRNVVSARHGDGIKDGTQYNWRKRFGGMGRSHLSEQKSLEKENAGRKTGERFSTNCSI